MKLILIPRHVTDKFRYIIMPEFSKGINTQMNEIVYKQIVTDLYQNIKLKLLTRNIRTIQL